MTESNFKRFALIDLLRGLAVCGMVLYHLIFILKEMNLIEFNFRNIFVEFIGDLIRITFLSLVGFSMVIAYKKSKTFKKIFIHGLKILVAAVLVSLASFIFTPHAWIKFGILHLIGSAIILLIFCVNRKFIALSISLLTFGTHLLFELKIQTSFLLYPLGFRVINSGASYDYFPIIPWIGFVSLGIFLGNIFFDNSGKNSFIQKLKNFQVNNSTNKFLIFCGQNALKIYLLHVPMILIPIKIIEFFS